MIQARVRSQGLRRAISVCMPIPSIMNPIMTCPGGPIDPLPDPFLRSRQDHRALAATSATMLLLWGCPTGEVPILEPIPSGDPCVPDVDGLLVEWELADRCVGNHGPIFRAVASFDEDGAPRYRYACPFGHTGEASDWIDGTYAELPFLRDEVEARTADVRTLEP